MDGFKYKGYEIYPHGQGLLKEDGSPGGWMALATVVRWEGDGMKLVPVSWYPPALQTEDEAKAHAARGAREMIDAGRCKI